MGVAIPVTCRPESTNFWFDHSTACNKLCVVGVLVRSVRTSHACNFQESRQSGLQLAEMLAQPLKGTFYKHFTSRFFRFWRKQETVFFELTSSRRLRSVYFTGLSNLSREQGLDTEAGVLEHQETFSICGGF